MRIYEAGESGPSVVLVAGAGDCAASWVPVADKIATFACVTSYDRAGMGGSGNGPPPTLDRYLAELSSVIAQARGDRPFILAGHSLGGLTVRIYAQQDAADVAGLVLVDASPEAVAGDPAVKAGFLASAAMTSVFRVLAPFRFCPVSPRDWQAAVPGARRIPLGRIGRGLPAIDRRGVPRLRRRRRTGTTLSPAHGRSVTAAPSGHNSTAIR